MRSSNSALTKGLIGALILLVAAPALAAPKKKKKKAPAAESGEIGTTEEGSAAKPEPGAAQASDQERPRTMPSFTMVAPIKDSLGRVHFGATTNTGKVSVKAPAAEKIQVLLDGRYFGEAPVTIHSIPKGDYIVEGHLPEGKIISKPVSVSDDEATVELMASPDAADKAAPTRGSVFNAEMTPKRLQAAKILVISGGSLIVVGAVFGILKYTKEQEYQEGVKTREQLDDIAGTGRTYSMLANLSFLLGGAALLGAVWAAYPMFVTSGETPAPAATPPPPVASFMLVPGPGSAHASFALQF